MVRVRAYCRISAAASLIPILVSGDSPHYVTHGVLDNPHGESATSSRAGGGPSSRFVRAVLPRDRAGTGSGSVYWEAAGIKYLVRSCDMCEGEDVSAGDICSPTIHLATQGHLDSVESGHDFQCEQYLQEEEGDSAAESYARCDHGVWDHHHRACSCQDNWRIAGPTDTFDFLRGMCTQSMCESDEKCTADLQGILDEGEEASCPIAGWNCYCGWKYAWAESMTGASNDRSKCMGVLYVMSFQGGYAIRGYMEWTWQVFLVLMLMCLPLGQTHVRCQHHAPDMCKMAHHIFERFFFRTDRYAGTEAERAIQQCNGSCTQHPISDVWYTFAWSIYVFDLAVWTYAFLGIMYLIFLVTWAVLMWLVVALICIAAFLCGGGGEAACGLRRAVCGGGGDVAGDGDCCACEGGAGGGCGDCGGNGGCGDCCCGGSNNDLLIWSAYGNNNIYVGGPGTSSDCCGDCNCCGDCSCKGPLNVCRPAGWIISKFPRTPPNMWGGVLGKIMGTGEGGSYAGGNRFIDYLSFRSATDNHANTDWRNSVASYIYSLSDEAPAGPDAVQRPGTSAGDGRHDLGRPLLQQDRPRTMNNKVLVQTDKFDQERDNIVQSCFDDYKKNECWICTSCNHGLDVPAERQWHLWLTCGHMFCHQCSAEMSRRRMPCPLCRRTTNRIKEGPCHPDHAAGAAAQMPNAAVRGATGIG